MHARSIFACCDIAVYAFTWNAVVARKSWCALLSLLSLRTRIARGARGTSRSGGTLTSLLSWHASLSRSAWGSRVSLGSGVS